MKSLQEDPWQSFADENGPGTKLKGQVARIQEFGAFITLAPGIDGLLHVSAISATERIDNPAQVLKEGQEVDVVVEQIDSGRKRIGLMTPEVAEARQPVDITCKVNDVVKGPVTKVERFGVFIEISPKVIGLIPNAEMATNRVRITYACSPSAQRSRQKSWKLMPKEVVFASLERLFSTMMKNRPLASTKRQSKRRSL